MKGAMKTNWILPVALMCLTMVFTTVEPSSAMVLYEQPLDTSSGGKYSNLGGWVVADQFTLPYNSRITDVHWYGYYGLDLEPSITSLDFQIQFGNGNSSIPENLLYDQLISAQLADTGLFVTDGGAFDGRKIYRFTADPISPFDISGGEMMWLSIYEADASTPAMGENQWLWSASPVGGSSLAIRNTFPGLETGWEALSGNMAFSLTGTPVIPEPTSLLLFGTGIMGAVIRRRRS